MSNLIYTLYPLSCIFIPCILYMSIQRFGFHQKASGIHILWVFIFLYYVYLVLETTGIGTIWEIGMYPGMTFKKEVNLIPFAGGITISLVLNIIMFMPLGFLLPLLWKEYKNLIRTAMTGLFFSLGIELCQLCNRRVSDVDDLIMNTLGAVIGWGIWLCFSRLFKLRYGNRNKSFGSLDAAAYLLLSLVGQFFLYNWRWMLTITQP